VLSLTGSDRWDRYGNVVFVVAVCYSVVVVVVASDRSPAAKDSIQSKESINHACQPAHPAVATGQNSCEFCAVRYLTRPMSKSLSSVLGTYTK
jgi:hypothetical protein